LGRKARASAGQVSAFAVDALQGSCGPGGMREAMKEMPNSAKGKPKQERTQNEADYEQTARKTRVTNKCSKWNTT